MSSFLERRRITNECLEACYKEHRETAKNHEEHHRFEEAGKEFFKSAKCFDLRSGYSDPWQPFEKYKRAANCFVRAHSKEAITSFTEAVKFLYNPMGGFYDDLSFEAVYFCIEFGYICEKELFDPLLANNLYTMADEWRLERGIPHTCPLTTFEPANYENDASAVMVEKNKFLSKKFKLGGGNITACVYAGSALVSISKFVSSWNFIKTKI
ncbi:hypothetical protein RF11_00148 [Thelohanellus kitauei]|uniref:Beta-soluble NSF attachment protein n=1 Tax=Thelohanellus kitauei TaxID=669202 RepID=A0A0C2MSU4_THEKT|nr:hypothetical protein RF11_00148 [Thelohanellus kitauei]